MGPVNLKSDWARLGLPPHVIEVLGAAPKLLVPESREDLLNWALGREAGETDWRFMNREDKGEFEVAFDVGGMGRVVEAVVTKAQRPGSEFSRGADAEARLECHGDRRFPSHRQADLPGALWGAI